jgi:hypothetical protein
MYLVMAVITVLRDRMRLLSYIEYRYVSKANLAIFRTIHFIARTLPKRI